MFNITQQHSDEFKAIKELQTMENYSQSALTSFQELVNAAYHSFWYGSVSPSIKAELLGAEAINVFTKSAQAQAFIKSQIPDYVEPTIPAEYQISWNQDGSAVITPTQPEA